MGKMPALKSFEYMNNYKIIRKIDTSILALKNVESIFIHGSDKEPYEVTPNISKLTKLKELGLHGAPVIPDTLSQLTNLENLSVSLTYRAKLPLQAKHFETMTKLKVFRLNGKGADILEGLAHCKELEELWIRHCENVKEDAFLKTLDNFPKLKKVRYEMGTANKTAMQQKYPHIEFI